MHQFIFNDINTADYGFAVSGEDTWERSIPELDRVTIPGRSGDLVISGNRYANVEVTYLLGIPDGFAEAYDDYIAALLSSPGYHRLEDSYHPEHYRLGFLSSEIKPKVSRQNRVGTVELTFSCKPQRFLKAGEQTVALTSSGSIYNPTRYAARPLLRVYGTGELGVGSETITISSADGYTDIDCELQDAFKGIVNCNSNILLSSGEFPTLPPGTSGVSLGNGITRIEITPRWWTL